MSRLMITSDLHLGHKSICRYRPQFSTMEEHNEILFDNLASNVTKRDTLFLLGDIAFDIEWHLRIADIKCKHKVLILGNHDTDRKPKVHQFAHCYDKIHGLLSHRNYWWSHCPMHPQELRGRLGNIHGHLHGNPSGLEHYRIRDVSFDATGNIVTSMESFIADALTGQIKGHHGD